MKFEVGQTVFIWRDGDYARGGLVATEVTSVGRVWVTTTSGERFDRATGYVDGPGLGTAYASAEEFEAKRLLRAKWSALRLAVERTWGAPGKVTSADIEAAAVALRLELPETR